jgi:hypothetical protein
MNVNWYKHQNKDGTVTVMQRASKGRGNNNYVKISQGDPNWESGFQEWLKGKAEDRVDRTSAKTV